MSWHDGTARRGVIRLALAMGVAALVGGCFQPLYATHTVDGRPGVGQALRAVDVALIDAPNGTPAARLAVEVRDQILFDLQGGSERPSPTHRLRVRLASSDTAVIVDPVTGRTDVGNYRVTATFTLTEVGSNRQVLAGSTTTRVSFDAPGQQQRFARARGERDAEDRAAKVIAENIRARLASYFVAGT